MKAGKIIELVLSGAFYVISTTFTFLLFIELGSSSLVYSIVFGAFSIVLEGAKAVTWVQGIRLRNPTLVFLALCAVVVSLGGSIGSAFMIVQSGDASVVGHNPRIGEIEQLIASEDANIKTWQDAIDNLPKYYMDKAEKFGVEIAKAIERKTGYINELAAERNKTKTVNASALFDAIEEGLGWSSSTVRFFFLLAASILIEAFAFALSYAALKTVKKTMTFIFDGSMSHIKRKNGTTLCGFTPMNSSTEAQLRRPCAACMQKWFNEEEHDA
jgi:hypothetical protein